jgi:hypothetical protein
MGHSRGTVTAPAAAGGSTTWGFGPEPRAQAIMGTAIGGPAVAAGANLANVHVPTFLVAGGLDRNSFQSVSESALTQIPSADERLLPIPLATHRSFDSMYCAQSAGARAQANPRALLDMHTVNRIAAAPPSGASGRAINYCARSFFTTPVEIGWRRRPIPSRRSSTACCRPCPEERASA